ncbi:hypothetical protein T440DRAFT_48294 [Plenodomus tracheiphilus IPT5]|uniref:Integral membrane protein n=1 Tax=Plenodomus tracheiphilus IPT5 TaxID=1408161 RepID=A0A6A7B989_9PLEO|nr:hypothetical protein T440DRAFT_48294 [Plenodomus tracheiphilus IPT5]
MNNRPPPLPPRPQTQSTARSSAVSRFYRPATPPTNIPASQASEYIYYDKCTGRVALGVFWFKNNVAPNFLVCGTCFERHIRYTPLAATFTGRLERRTESGVCMFDVPRVQDTLWPPENRSGSLAKIHAYMIERSKLPRCRGMAGLNGADARACGMKWYTFAQDAIPEFLACQACLEERIVGTRFQNMFTPRSTLQGDADQWSCDLAVPYIKRLVKWAANSGDWSAMIQGIKRRLYITACPSGSPVKASTRTWHRPEAWPHASVCDSCYLDHVALTNIDQEFIDMPVPFGQRQSEWTCDLAGLPAQEATEMAVARKDTTLLHRFFKVITTHPACTPKGIVGGKWYTLKGGCQNFDICAICYTGLIETYYLDNEFQMRTDVRSDQLLGCDFCPGMGRSMQYLNKFAESLLSPRFEIFTSYVRRTAQITPCQGTERVKNSAWWKLEGTQNFVACQDCHENVVRDTRCSDMFTMVGVVEGGVLCCMYSANMRQRYNNLCAADSPNARVNFVAYANHRQSVYSQTVPVMQNLLAQARIKLSQQRMNNINSSFYQNLDRTVGNANGIHFGPEPAYKTVWESSTTGYRYNTAFGIDAENYAAKGRAAAQGVYGNTTQIRMLEIAWKEVE